MGSNRKRSGGGVVVWCVVLGLAVLVDAAVAQRNPLPPLTDCATFCHDYPAYYDRCLYICRYGLRVGAHVGAGQEEEVRGGGGGVGLLAEGAGREEEEAKRKQGGRAVHLPGWYCRERCHGKQDYMYCLRRCMASPSSGTALGLAAHRGIGGEETRGGGRVGLQADGVGREDKGKKKQEEDAPVQLDHSPDFCSFMCHYVHDKEDCLRQCEMGAKGEEARGGGVGLLEEGAGRKEEERKQVNMVVHPPWSCELECEDTVDPDFDPDSYMACVRDCYKWFGNAVRRRGADGKEARGGGGAGLLVMPAERAVQEEVEEGKMKQEDAAVHLTYDQEAYCYDLCIRKKGPEFPKCMKSCVDKVN